MTNTSTMDTEGCAEQIARIVKAGGEYVRLTTQGTREACNLENIRTALPVSCNAVPLIADVHFNPHVADVAALYANKVRINPGNYVDAPKNFQHVDYTDEEYQQELQKIHDRFVPFLRICKEHGVAIRIGVNHGSLSDRIMSRYGDTPQGMVESCMEFLRICVKEQFLNVVLSIKASNTVIMVKTVRLLADRMQQEGMDFPIHLGVTEAGEGEDGRIKSAAGIGALLADGIGDTIRVSLSEAPEAEIPVARKLRDYIIQRENHLHINAQCYSGFDYLNPKRRKTTAVLDIGGDHQPVVIAARLHGDEAFHPSFIPDYIYIGKKEPKETEKQRYIVDADTWTGAKNTYPAYTKPLIPFIGGCNVPLKFLFINYNDMNDEVLTCLRYHPEIVLLVQSNHTNRLGEQRAVAHRLLCEGILNPIVFIQQHNEQELEDFQIKASAELGALIIDGLCDGVFLHNKERIPVQLIDETAFSILQACRVRTSKTEYISCPGCGRTLYNLQETIARIKAATSHLKGLKIGIMGCIVNGPGEMADADYGYVGAGRGKISLYKQQTCIAKNIPEDEAVERLIQLIKENGDYTAGE